MKRESGFTLIEVLIAMAIGAIMLTGIFATLNSMVQTRSTVVGFSTPYALGPQILDAIEADLKNVYFYDIKENDGFWGADKDIAGREADGISFLTSTLGHVGDDPSSPRSRSDRRAEAHRRRSPTTEVQYVCRQSTTYPELLRALASRGLLRGRLDPRGRQLPTRLRPGLRLQARVRLEEHVDGRIVGQPGQDRRADAPRQLELDRGARPPRAVIVTISIYGRDPEKTWEHEPEVFVFRRWIPLPQVHESTQSEGQIATWDGTLKETRAPGAPRARTGRAARAARPARRRPPPAGRDGRSQPVRSPAAEPRPARGLAGQLVVP